MDPPRHNLGQRVNQPDGRRCNSSPRPRTQSIGSVGPFSRAKLDHFWRAPKPAHTAIRYILHRLSAEEVERVFREHAANLNCAPEVANARAVAFDGKTLKGSFDNFNDAKAKQVLSAFAVDTGLVLAHIEIDEKSNEIPAMQQLLRELGLADHIATGDAIHCQKKPSRPPPPPTCI